MDNLEQIRLFNLITLMDERCEDPDSLWHSIEEDIRSVSQNIHHIHTSRVVLYRYLVAAVVVIGLISAYFFNNKTYRTSDNKISLVLPDDSHVELDSNSNLKYNKIAFKIGRSIVLDGAAKFKVTKGENFTVKTTGGHVRVLGTEFFVFNNHKTLHVECMSGSVEVTTPAGKEILTHGDAYSSDGKEQKMYKVSEAEEMPEYYIYSDSPLSEVLQKLQELYSVEIRNLQVAEGKKYTGVLLTNNLSLTLDVILSSCGVKYNHDKDIIVLE